ncbi:uncharacterized protein [Apostichopus japonicus]|uniref:uncharacterized protein isoform X3 n=1 Tax=Stichopus japonicus TaxID=307972 RepID=UPI003AB38BF7
MADSSPATENLSDNTKMNFGRFKVRLAELLTTEIILKLATFFMFTPAKIDELRNTKKSPGLLMVSLMEERGKIKPNDISPLLTALDELGLDGLRSTLHSIFKESEDKTCQFVRYLKTFYKQLYSKINPIPYIREKVFRVNDIFVEGGIEMHRRDNNDTERLLEGNTMEAVKLNSYRDVFNDDIISSKRILLEGDPGYGKSTFTLQAAYDWCNASDSSPLKDVSIFILLPLRLLGGISSFCQAIKLVLMPGESNLTEEDIMEILRNSPGAVLVFDGYDEYPDKDNIEISDVMKIIAGNMFGNFKVITCTRSSYIPDNLDVETVNVRLTGFDDNTRDEYIRRAVAVNDNQAARRINDLLTSSPVLSDICQVPLFCVMFVHISYDSKNILSFASVTSFFRHILTCFYEHMRNKMGHARKRKDCYIIPNHPKLNKLLFDALTGKNQQIVWQKNDFKNNVGDGCYNELISIGILLEEDILKINDTPVMAAVSVIQRTTVVRFYHKLFAEWYAANYLSKCAGRMEHGALWLQKEFEKINPVDLQFVFRFACGLNKKASSRIMKYLKGIEDGQSLAILCFFEQVGETDDVVAMVKDLLTGGVTITSTDSRLLQRSTIQILDIAAKSDIPITSVCLNKSFKECEEDIIVLHSGLKLNQLLTVEKIHIETEQVNKEPRVLTKEDVMMIFRYGLRSEHLKDLSFDNCLLPPSFASESILSEMKSRDIKVSWRNYGYSLNLQSGAWKVDDVDTVKRICTEQVTIRRDDSEVLQRCTIQLLENASHHDIPISELLLVWSFSKVDTGDIVLKSGLCLPTLSTLEKLSVNANSAELTEEDVIAGLMNYGVQSRRFKELWFYRCKLPTSISSEMIPETARSRNIKVLWPDTTCQLDLQSGKWKQAEDIQTITELCSNDVGIVNKNSLESQKSTIELLKKASRHDIPIDCVFLVGSFNKVDEDDITLYSGLSLPILTSIENMYIYTEKGREMNKHEVNGILNYVQHSQRFKQLDFRYCLLPPTIASSSLANLKARNVKVFWYPYDPNERNYRLDLQSGRWLLYKDPESFFPMLKRGEELTDADYANEVKAFRNYYSEEEWQLTYNASFYRCKLPTSISPAMIPGTAKSRNVKVLWPENIGQPDLQSGKWKQAEDIQTITELCSNAVVINNESSQESQKSTMELLKKASRHDASILTFSDLREELSLKLTQTDCGNLARYFSLPPDKVQTIITCTLYSKNFLLALEERGYIHPSNVNRLTDALIELKINDTHLLTETYMKLIDQETEYDRFLAGVSAHLTFSITVKLCDNFEVTDKNKKTVISSQNPGLSFLQTIDEMGIINPSDVSKLKTTLEEYHLVQAVAKIHEYQSLVLSDETMPQDEGKENLFIKSLQQKMKSWFETMTPVPWKKSCQWKSNDLFIASGLVLTNSGSKISSREVDQKCKLHYRDIFTHQRLKEETRIILEGQPGSGKTMLSSQLAYDWCCGKLMDIPMVIYLPLKIVDNMTIYQAIKMFYIRKGIPITEEDIESMLNSGKKKVYLILDGLEEYNGVTKDGSPSEVMRVMTKDKLSNCIVIITTRTDYTKHLPPGPMLTIGSFGEDERNEYIEKVYSDYLKRQEEVKELINNVPFILDICNVPLLFVLLIHNIDRLGKLQESKLDRVTPFVKAIVDILCSVQDDENTSGHVSYQQQEYTSAKYVSISESVTSIDPQDTCITLEELAFNGLCKGNQQLFWHKDFVDRCVRNSKAWIDAGLLVVEEGTPFNSPSRDLQTDSGSESSQTDSISDESLNTSNVTSEIKRGLSLDPDLLGSLGDLQTVSGSESPQTDSISDKSLNTSNVTSEIKKGVSLDPDRLGSLGDLQTVSGSESPQTDSISDKSLNTSNVTSEIKKGVSLEPDLLESINRSKNKPILESKEKKSELLQKKKAAKYVSLQVKFLHKLIQEWFAAKHLALLFWGHKLTEHHYKYHLFREHLANIDPADLHYVLRFTCHICPPSFNVIASFLMRDFKTGDCEIPDYIMNCICLCFAEYDGYKGHKVKDIVKEVCRRESVNFSSEDSRLLLRSKVSMLTFASRSQIPIKCLKLSDVVEKVTEKALILKADVSLGVLKTLRAIEVNRWDLKLIEQDYEDLIKFVINNEMVEVACLLFPRPPVAVKDEKDLNNLQSRNISVEWIIGATLIHTLDVTTGEWMMEFRLPERMSASSSLKPISENLRSNPLKMELWINKDGGVLELPDTGVSLDIPPGALEKDQLIHMRIIPYNFQGDSDLSFSSNLSVVVELLPSNLKLLKPVNLTLPHCLVLKKGCEWKAKIYSSHHEEGNQPVWRPQPDTPYVLTERNCVIKLKNFSWEKFDIGDEIVEGKRIVLYAAKDLSSSESITQIHVGYYLDLPGGEKIVSINAVSVLVKQSAVFFKQGKLPLTCHFVKIKPPDWTYDAEEKKTKEISFTRVATSKGGFCIFDLNIKEGTHERHNCKCHFKAGQGSELVELHFILKDGEEDSAASSSDKLVDAGLSQSQKGTCDESQPVKQPLENIDLKASTESLMDLSGKIPNEWKNVGRILGLKDPELCILERDNNNQGLKEAVYQMLRTWKHSNGSKATYRVLGEALLAVGRRDLQEILYKQAGIKQES